MSVQPQIEAGINQRYRVTLERSETVEIEVMAASVQEATQIAQSASLTGTYGPWSRVLVEVVDP